MNERITLTALFLPLVALAGPGSGCSAVAPNGQSASTITAAAAVSDEVEKGNMEVEGDTDTAPVLP